MISFLILAGCALAQTSTPVVGGLVKSDEWIVRRGQVKEEEFKGNVRYKAGPTDIAADWALYKHASRSWKARGRVKAVQAMEDGSRLEGYGEEAEFSHATENGFLAGRDGVKVKRLPPEGGEPDEITAMRLSWEGRRKAVLYGAVRLSGPRLETACDRAEYSAPQERLDLTGGRPILLKHKGWAGGVDDWNGAFQADVISGSQSHRRISAVGNVKGWAAMSRDR